MKCQYIIRLDDICPTMDWPRFTELRLLCNSFSIRPIVGIVPDNQDKALAVNPPRPDFWNIMREVLHDQWIIAQHGYQHIYKTKEAGILGINHRSEFAGLPYEEQYRAIARGKSIIEQNLGKAPTWWMAPAHSFDATTCQVIKDLSFTHITDGVALYPFEHAGLTWVPQQLWQPRSMVMGTWTICLHLNTITDTHIQQLTQFIQHNQLAFQQVSFTPRQSILNIPFRAAWYMYLRNRQTSI